MAIIHQYNHDFNPTRKNPTPIAQAQGWVDKAYRIASEIEDDPALMMQAYKAAFYVDDLYTRRYDRWQAGGGKSNWSPIDIYNPEPETESVPAAYNIYWSVQ